MVKQTVAYSYQGILLRNQRELTIDTCRMLDGFQGYLC